MHVWYPTTVATLSRHVKALIAEMLDHAGEPHDGLPFMLHDFGYRGAATHDAAALGGAAHLVNFCGTDTLPALLLARDSYDADLSTLGFSVPATEHSVMTAAGPEGELPLVERLLDEYPAGVVSVVADSYNVYAFLGAITAEPLRSRILARDGVFVMRPDSITSQHPTPAEEVLYLVDELYKAFGGTENARGFRLLDPHVRVLWGDGLDPRQIETILGRLVLARYSPACVATFGMGGGLLQKVDRDTERFAFKSSAQRRGGEWHDVCKRPLDGSKGSKAGRLELLRWPNGDYQTVSSSAVLDLAASSGDAEYVLQTVFEDGELLNETSFDEIVARAALKEAANV
jgi:nicotinamide phosphoribosyltransferase